MRKTWLAALLAALALLSGCHNGGHAQNSTDMRSVNAVGDSEPLDVLVDNDVKVSALALGSTSSFSEFDSGSRDVKIRSSTSGSTLADKSIAMASGVANTLLIYGHRASIQTQLLPDDLTTIDSGQFRVRVVNLAPDAGPVDLYLSTPITTAPVIVGGATYGSVTGSAELAPGSLPITFVASGTQDVLFQSAAPQTFAAGTYYTILVVPTQGGKQVNAMILTQGISGTSVYLQNPIARIKAVNDITDSSTVNFKVDNVPLLLAIPFGGNTAYVNATSGQHNLQVEASNVPGTNIATLSTSLLSARDYTAIATGTLASAQLTAILDDNTLPTAGFGKLRFINGLNGGGNVDFLVNSALQTSALPFVTASSYYTLAPSTTSPTNTYTITATTAGGVTVLATLTPVQIDAGGVYSVYLVGTSSNARLILARDR
jgi:hypothetical protein